MILKPKKLSVPVIDTKEEQKKVENKKTTNKAQINKLPPDEYKPLFDPKRILVRETVSQKTGTPVKQYMEFSVKRFDDEETLPMVWMTMYQESEFYTGYLKGKSVYFPLNVLQDVIESLSEVSEECEKREIE